MVPLVDVFKFNLILKQCERDNKAFETLFDFYYPRIKLHIHKKISRRMRRRRCAGILFATYEITRI